MPYDHGTTRLLLKVVSQVSRWAAPGLAVGDLVMARRQLLNLKQLAERHSGSVAGPDQRADSPPREKRSAFRAA